MTRQQFMQELQRLLFDLPEQERQEAIQYYNDYFDDAGPENEAKVIRELGSPAQVADSIKAGTSEHGEYTERGYEDRRYEDRQEIIPKKKPNLWKAACVALLCLILIPVIVPVFFGLLLTLISILLGILGISIGIVIAAVVLPIAGILVIGFGIYRLFLLPAVGITIGGIGCMLLAVGILLFLVTVWIIRSLLPFCIRSIVSLIRYPLRKVGIVK